VGAPGSGGFGFTQPGPAGSPVLPPQVSDPSSVIAPFSTTPVFSATGQFSFICSHIENMPVIYRDFDYETGMSVALVVCPTCSCVSGVIRPYEAAFNNFTQPIIIP
jgi:hypothetical protein